MALIDKQVENLMNVLGCTKEEALDIIECDKRIDKGEKLFEMTAEQKKASKEARQADRAPTVYKFTERKRKENPTKAQIVSKLLEAVLHDCEEYEVANAEREFTFKMGGVKYKVVLSCPRS